MSGCDGDPVGAGLEGSAGNGGGKAVAAGDLGGGDGGGDNLGRGAVDDVGAGFVSALVVTGDSCPVGAVQRESSLPFAGAALMAALMAAVWATTALDGAGSAAGRSEAGRAPTAWRYAATMAVTAKAEESEGLSRVPAAAGTAAMAIGVLGTTTAGGTLGAAAPLTSPAGEDWAMPPLINAMAGMVAQAFRHGTVTVRA